MALRHASRPGAIVGIVCGVAAAAFWACGFVAARHGIAVGLSPFDIAFHRYVWAGLLFLPGMMRAGRGDLGGIGWGRGFVFAMLGGPGQAAVSAAGFLLVPLGHGGVIQPACAVVAGLVLSTVVLKEKQPTARLAGAAVIVVGVALIGSEALAAMGTGAVAGDLAFAMAGMMFAVFAMLLRRWRIDPVRATATISVLTLAYVPLHALAFGFGRMIAAGWHENIIQVVVQGIFSGPLSIYLFARSVALLGASRAAVFPALVPGLTLLVGFVTLGETPSVPQAFGLAVVLIGFRMTQKA
jgi:drug/metabolite transporter (DMT)-like permease